ncbi:uncharacterized protein [Apostichopus japonicus]|uniref:uncharacterized protein isoform X3 n=1 Tax=Stichopus japonicus TaxID=307972 RepID=UPI003AB6AD78
MYVVKSRNSHMPRIHVGPRSTAFSYCRASPVLPLFRFSQQLRSMEGILSRLEYNQLVIDNFRREGVTPEAATLMNSGQFQQLGVEGVGRQAILISRCRAYMLRIEDSAGRSAVSNLFQPYSNKKKKRKSLVTLEFVCLALPSSERIPSDLTKKILKSAGLGKKKLALDSAMTASELREHLFDEYPKLRDAGGFQYLKTSGQHKVFEVIPLAPSGGYSVANIKAIVKQAKVYLRPIQAELDLSAVTEDVSVVDDTLQECFICHVEIPETKLKQHRESCNGKRDDSALPGPSTPVISAPQRLPTSGPVDSDDTDLPCPSLTPMVSTPQRSVVPANSRDSSALAGPSAPARSTQQRQPPSTPADRYVADYIDLLEPDDSSDDELQHVIEDSLKDIDSNRDDTILEARMQEKLGQYHLLREEEKFHVVVRWRKILKCAADAINSQAGFSFFKDPVICFSGEEAVDLGGPRREFFTLATQQLSHLGIFEGKTGKLYFTHDIVVLEKGLYRLAGQIIAWSILHGGPGFPTLHPWLYSMMCDNKPSEEFSTEDVTDPDVMGHLQKIENCSSEALLEDTITMVGDWAANNGCPAIYSMSMANKEDILQTLFKQHIYYRCKSEIDDFKRGLDSVGKLWSMIHEDPAPFRCLLVMCDHPLTFSSVKKLFHIRWSENCAHRDKEEETIYCWEEFLRKAWTGDCSQDIELDDGTTDNIKIELHHILRFCTGADGIPPTGFHKQIDMEFFSVRDGTKPLPIASTCGLELHLPRGVEDTKFFADMMMEAILCSPGFGKM